MCELVDLELSEGTGYAAETFRRSGAAVFRRYFDVHIVEGLQLVSLRLQFLLERRWNTKKMCSQHIDRYIEPIKRKIPDLPTISASGISPPYSFGNIFGFIASLRSSGFLYTCEEYLKRKKRVNVAPDLGMKNLRCKTSILTSTRALSLSLSKDTAKSIIFVAQPGMFMMWESLWRIGVLFCTHLSMFRMSVKDHALRCPIVIPELS